MTSRIEHRVLPNDLCIGCGGCAWQAGEGVTMGLDARGQYRPLIATDSEPRPGQAAALAQADRICPFSGEAPDETLLGQALFGDMGLEHDARLGFHAGVQVGHAVEGDFRLAGSSGGLTNWLLHELFARDEIDAVIGVGEFDAAPGGTQFGYQVVTAADQLGRLAKSKYYPITLDEVLAQIEASDQRYAFVGVPCFVKTMRNLCREHAWLDQRLTYCLAVVCGHLKSRAFADALGWELGIAPEALAKIDFRVKVPGYPANRYAVRAQGQGVERQRQVFDLFTTDWGLGFFKYKACDFCDDIAGETADITFGDAWLPEPVKAWQGNNIVVTRHPRLARLMDEAAAEGRIVLTASDSQAFVASQAANYRHRHAGLAVRLEEARACGEWVPDKRIAPGTGGLSSRRRRAIRQRSELRVKSHAAFLEARRRGRFGHFVRAMLVPVLRYQWHAGRLLRFVLKRALVALRKVVPIRV